METCDATCWKALLEYMKETEANIVLAQEHHIPKGRDPRSFCHREKDGVEERLVCRDAVEESRP